MAVRESTAVGYRLRLQPPGGLSTYPDRVKLMWFQWVVDLGLQRKDRELARGMDKDGKIGVLHPETIKHRKSEVGPTTPTAPFLTPSYARSRVRSLLTGRAHTGSAEFWWSFDAVSGRSFAAILHHQAENGHDVFGLSPAGTAWVTREASKRWRAWLAEGHHGRPAVSPVGVPVRKVAVLKPASEIKGRLDLGNMDLTIPESQIEQAIKAGRFAGFRRLNAKGEKWKPGHQLGPIRRPPPAMQRAAMGPKPARLKGDALIARSQQILKSMGVPSRSGTLEEIQAAVPELWISNKHPAIFDRKTGVVWINTTAEHWQNPAKTLKLSKYQGWFSMHTEEHTAIHEGVHALHLIELTRQLGSVEQARAKMKAMALETFQGDQLRQIQKAVGRYAAIAPTEFVAEVGAAVRQGKAYPEWVMALYRELGGPRP